MSGVNVHSALQAAIADQFDFAGPFVAQEVPWAVAGQKMRPLNRRRNPAASDTQNRPGINRDG